MNGPVSVYISRRNNNHKLPEQLTAKIAPACEKAVGLNQPDLKFRSEIAGAIDLACAMEYARLAGDAREVLPTVPPATVQEYKDLAKLLSRKERQYKAFNLLVKCLANAYWDATGKRHGIKFPYPPAIEARERKIRRILKVRKHLYPEAAS